MNLLIIFFKNTKKELNKKIYIFLEKLFDEKIIKTKNGKPFVKSKKFYFNISYSKDLCIIVISRESEVGVDIVSKSVFVDNNIYNSKYIEIEYSYKKYELFAIKEAIIKYEGKTLSSINEIKIIDYINNLYKIELENYVVFICFEKNK